MIKKVYLPYYEPGKTDLYAEVYQVYTGKFLDNIDGFFKTSPDNKQIPLIETDPGVSSIYYFTENRQLWADGPYHVYGYDNSGTLFSVAEFFIFYNREVSQSEMEDDIKLIKEDVDEQLAPTYPVGEGGTDIDLPPVFDEEPNE